MIERFGERGKAAATELTKWLQGGMPYAYPDILERHLDEKHLKLVFDAFYQVLPFGTGGRRGPVGYGSNRLNPTTVAMTIQGHCDYLHKAFKGSGRKLTVVVANDVRLFKDIAGTYKFLGDNHPLIGVSSRSLGRLACEIYAGNGITAYFAKPLQEMAVLTTPELSFLIKQLDAIGGINLSASHNPPDDNGVKVYDEYGSQPVAPNDQLLVEAMNEAQAIKEMPFQKALEAGLIREIPDSLHEDYIQAYVTLFGDTFKPLPDVKICYTPLCGCGLTTAGETMTRVGFPLEVPPRQDIDGTFAEIPFKAPNPEVPEATAPAKAFADSKGIHIVLSSDPDADRIGMEIKLKDGTWYHFDGNQIGAILCYYLMLDPKGPQRKGLVIETLVTTKMLGEIVKRSPGSKIIDELLVGFKYVADVLKSLELTGRYVRHNGEVIEFQPSDLVLAAEESHGIIVLPSIRDKDATPGCLYLAALYQRLHQEGRTMLDYYLHMLDEVGACDAITRSIVMYGADGTTQKDAIMLSLRTSPPKELDGQPVHPAIVDYWDEKVFGKFKSETDKLPRNVFQFRTDTCVITVRPSGTEPKIKLYCQFLSDGNQSGPRGMELFTSVRDRTDRVARLVYRELLKRAGLLDLGDPALLLPDIVAFDRKKDFQEQTIPMLREGLEKQTWADLDALKEWLRSQTERMTPGANPLPALRAPVAYLCAEWSKEGLQSPLLADLKRWAGA
jgi:phosphoglucomutase/phosphomannomutase